MLPTMSQPWTGAVAILVNVLVTGVALALLKKNVKEGEQIEVEEEDIDLDDIKII